MFLLDTNIWIQAAQRDNLQIVSFDKDFDKTLQGRLTPKQAIAKINEQREKNI